MQITRGLISAEVEQRRSTPWGIELILKRRVAVTGLRNILAGISRLRRLVVSDRWFFITCHVLPWRGILTASEFACLGRLAQTSAL